MLRMHADISKEAKMRRVFQVLKEVCAKNLIFIKCNFSNYYKLLKFEIKSSTWKREQMLK
jgi:hypothetical protein